jgi:hypothetical protein
VPIVCTLLAKHKTLKTQRFNLRPPGKKAMTLENFPCEKFCTSENECRGLRGDVEVPMDTLLRTMAGGPKGHQMQTQEKLSIHA